MLGTKTYTYVYMNGSPYGVFLELRRMQSAKCYDLCISVLIYQFHYMYFVCSSVHFGLQ